MFHWFDEKKNQKKAARAATYSSAAVLTFAGIWGFTYMIKGANLQTSQELDYSGKITAYGVVYLLLLLASAGYSWALIKHPKKQWAIRSYTSLLFFWAAVFAAIAVKAPSYANDAAERIEFQCANDTRPLNQIDAIVYSTADAIFCRPGCECYGLRNQWNKHHVVKDTTDPNNPQVKDEISNTINPNGMFHDDRYKNIIRVQNCPDVENRLNYTYLNYTLQNATNITNFNINALGAVETDFNCAGMCQNTTMFTFSNVTQGPPTIYGEFGNCSYALENFAHNVAKTAQTWYWIYFSLIFVAASYLATHWIKEHNKLHSPLLGK